MKLKRKIYKLLNRVIHKIQQEGHPDYPNISATSYIGANVVVKSPKHLYMEEHTNINDNALIMNGSRGKFIMKKYSGAGSGFTAIGGEHMSMMGYTFKQMTQDVKKKLDVTGEYSQGIVVNEDVWIGNNVTLLQGVVCGRGSIIGAGSVVRDSVPPYSIVIGNPGKVVGFRFRPDEIIEHEKAIFTEEERLPLNFLEENYKKYFLNRLQIINDYLKK